jgi:hypothetical protein
MYSTHAAQATVAHQARYALAAHPQPLGLELGVDARAAVGAPAAPIGRLDGLGEPLLGLEAPGRSSACATPPAPGKAHAPGIWPSPHG